MFVTLINCSSYSLVKMRYEAYRCLRGWDTLPIFEQRLRQLGQIEVERPILESIGTKLTALV